MIVIAENRKALHDYQILEKFEAGISLIGQEVRSIKSGRINLKGAYVVLRDEEVYLVGCNVPPYQPKNAPFNYNPQRSRKLLLKKSEIKYLIGKVKQGSLTLIPLRVYTKRGKIKIEFAVAKGLKKVDKREKIKKREIDRKIHKLIQ